MARPPSTLATQKLTREQREALFPKLAAAMIERLARFGKRRTAKAGELLVEAGDTSNFIFVVLSGGIEILDLAPGGETLVTVHEEREFTGEAAMLAGHKALFRSRARVDSELIEIDRAALRRIVETDAELGELFLRVFLQRRATIVARNLGGVVLVGSNHSADTLRLREFLTRSGHPFTYLDVDQDTGVQTLLDQFHVGVDEIPVLL